MRCVSFVKFYPTRRVFQRPVKRLIAAADNPAASGPKRCFNVSEKFPEVAQRLRAKHDAWLEKHGANVNYTPPAAKIPHEARPDGQVLEVRWAAPKNPAKAQLAKAEFGR